MSRMLCLTGLACAAIACTSPHSQSSPPPPAMPSPTPASIQTVTLIAQQETLPPLGTPPQSDRPIGFASIFLTLENPSDRTQSLELLNIEVIAVDNGKTQLRSDAAQTIKLMPLENAVLDIQLNNREGYGTEGEVKAIATYRINDTIHIVESPTVKIR